jgi:hypothetical protein
MLASHGLFVVGLFLFASIQTCLKFRNSARRPSRFVFFPAASTAMWRDRIKRLRVVVEHLLQSSDDEDEAQPHMDQYGNHLRRGGYHPTPQQQPDATGQQKWRHPWQASKLSKIFARTDTYDETSFGGKLFRSRTSVPRILFDELVTEAQRYPELPDHRAGDGQGKRGPSCIPLRIKLGGVLNWMRMGGSITSAADFADIDVQTLRRFGKSWARAVMLHEYSKHVCVPTGVALDNILEVHAKHGYASQGCWTVCMVSQSR